MSGLPSWFRLKLRYLWRSGKSLVVTNVGGSTDPITVEYSHAALKELQVTLLQGNIDVASSGLIRLHSRCDWRRLLRKQCGCWYCFHTDADIELTQAEVDLHARAFPTFLQLVLVTRPAREQSARAAFFVREEDGTLCSIL